MEYIVTGKVEASKIIGVFDAPTDQDAIEIARKYKNSDIILCHQCEDECLSPSIVEYIAEII